MRLMFVTLFVLGACSSSGDGDGGGAPDAATHTPADAAVDAKPVAPDAPAITGTVCSNKVDGGALIYTCNYQWKQCNAGADREVDCHIQAAGSLRFALCDCKVGGVSQKQFASTTICAQTTWGALE